MFLKTIFCYYFVTLVQWYKKQSSITQNQIKYLQVNKQSFKQFISQFFALFKIKLLNIVGVCQTSQTADIHDGKLYTPCNNRIKVINSKFNQISILKFEAPSNILQIKCYDSIMIVKDSQQLIHVINYFGDCLNWYFLNAKILNYCFKEDSNILVVEMIDRICIYQTKIENNQLTAACYNQIMKTSQQIQNIKIEKINDQQLIIILQTISSVIIYNYKQEQHDLIHRQTIYYQNRVIGVYYKNKQIICFDVQGNIFIYKQIKNKYLLQSQQSIQQLQQENDEQYQEQKQQIQIITTYYNQNNDQCILADDNGNYYKLQYQFQLYSFVLLHQVNISNYPIDNVFQLTVNQVACLSYYQQKITIFNEVTESITLEEGNLVSQVIEITSDSQYLISGDIDGQVCVTSLSTGEQQRIQLQEEIVSIATFHRDRCIAIATINNISLMDVKNLKVFKQIQVEGGQVSKITIEPEDTILAALINNEEVQFFDIQTGALLRQIHPNSEIITNICFVGSEGNFVASSLDKTISISNIYSSGNLNTQYVAFDQMCIDVVQRPGQNIVEVLTSDGLINTIDIQTLNQLNIASQQKQIFSDKLLKGCKNVQTTHNVKCIAATQYSTIAGGKGERILVLRAGQLANKIQLTINKQQIETGMWKQNHFSETQYFANLQAKKEREDQASRKVLDPITQIEGIKEKIYVKQIKCSDNGMWIAVLTNYGCYIYKDLKENETFKATFTKDDVIECYNNKMFSQAFYEAAVLGDQKMFDLSVKEINEDDKFQYQNQENLLQFISFCQQQLENDNLSIQAAIVIIKSIDKILVEIFYGQTTSLHKELSFMLNSFISTVKNKFGIIENIINKLIGYQLLSEQTYIQENNDNINNQNLNQQQNEQQQQKVKRVFSNDEIIMEKIQQKRLVEKKQQEKEKQKYNKIQQLKQQVQ